MSVRLAQPALDRETWSVMKAHWSRWAEQHGIDPDITPEDTTIECDDDARTITLQQAFLDVDGHAIYDGRRWRIGLVTVQLESPALPFPAPPFRPGGLIS